MGAGIAQLCAQYGYPTRLFDTSEAALSKAQNQINQVWNRLVEKGKATPEEVALWQSHLSLANSLEAASAELFIEAIVEKLEVKRSVFSQLSTLYSQAIWVSNTSSLSLTAIGTAVSSRGQFAGLHFFNPAPLMKLVEVVSTSETEPALLVRLADFVRSLDHVPVLCQDSPGFIVNRVARPYYTEALKLAEERIAPLEQIDALMEATGFRMGPFRLMDLIGNDINFSVTRSLFNAFHGEARFRPNRLQEEKVLSGNLGQKTGKGFYRYS